MKTKVLFVVEQLEDSRYYSDLFGHLESQNIEVWFYNLANFKFNPDILGERTILNKSSRYYFSIFNLNSICKKFDIIHAHESIPSFYTSIAIRLLKKHPKFIFHWHHAKSIGWKQYIMDKCAVNLADRVVFVSKSMKKLNESRFKAKVIKFSVIYNGMDVASCELGNKTAFDICLIGRLRPEKGFVFILDVLHKVIRKHKALKVRLYGSGPQEQLLKTKIEELGLSDNIKMQGHVYNPLPYLCTSKILVVPSFSEPFGLVAIEGMGTGAAVIASRVGGLKEIIQDNVNGVLVKPNDFDGFYRAIINLLENPNHREKLAEKAKETFIELYSIKQMADKYSKLYQELKYGSRKS